MRGLIAVAVAGSYFLASADAAELRIKRTRPPVVAWVVPQPVSYVLFNAGRPTEITYVLHPVRMLTNDEVVLRSKY